jgi:hypothetical protein
MRQSKIYLVFSRFNRIADGWRVFALAAAVSAGAKARCQVRRSDIGELSRSTSKRHGVRARGPGHGVRSGDRTSANFPGSRARGQVLQGTGSGPAIGHRRTFPFNFGRSRPGGACVRTLPTPASIIFWSSRLIWIKSSSRPTDACISSSTRANRFKRAPVAPVRIARASSNRRHRPIFPPRPATQGQSAARASHCR